MSEEAPTTDTNENRETLYSRAGYSHEISQAVSQLRDLHTDSSTNTDGDHVLQDGLSADSRSPVFQIIALGMTGGLVGFLCIFPDQTRLMTGVLIDSLRTSFAGLVQLSIPHLPTTWWAIAAMILPVTVPEHLRSLVEESLAMALGAAQYSRPTLTLSIDSAYLISFWAYKLCSVLITLHAMYFFYSCSRRLISFLVRLMVLVVLVAAVFALFQYGP